MRPLLCHPARRLLLVVAAGLVCQLISAVLTLADLKAVPADQIVHVHLSANLYVVLAALGLGCLFLLWNSDPFGLYGLLAVAAASLVLAGFVGDLLTAVLSALLVLLALLRLRSLRKP